MLSVQELNEDKTFGVIKRILEANFDQYIQEYDLNRLIYHIENIKTRKTMDKISILISMYESEALLLENYEFLHNIKLLKQELK